MGLHLQYQWVSCMVCVWGSTVLSQRDCKHTIIFKTQGKIQSYFQQQKWQVCGTQERQNKKGFHVIQKGFYYCVMKDDRTNKKIK